MIVRYDVKCLTCDTPYTLRMQMGHDQVQKHEIVCPNCHEDFTVALDVDFENISFAPRCVENCEESETGGKIINIDPYSPVPAELRHQDQVFPWLSYAADDLGLREKFAKLPPVERSEGGATFVDASALLGTQHRILDDWAVVKKGWSLALRGNISLAEKQFSAFKHLPPGDPPTLDHVVFAFCLHLISPGKYQLFSDAASFYAKLRKTKQPETETFRAFYSSTLRPSNLKAYLEVFSEYFRHFSDYSQTLLYTKNNTLVPEGSEVASTSFRKTKMFYGNAFETLTSGFTVLACLNNIKSGRPYDQFEKMDLAKYRTINKANRANPFQGAPELHAFAECVDSTLRNASHHGAILYDPVSGKVRYKSGGTGAEHTITYAEYTSKCNEIMLSMAALVALEIFIEF